MDVHLGRVVFENPEAANLEIVIDLVLEGRKAKAGLVYFGVWLDKEAEVTCPFVLDPNGQADFGTSYDGQDRYGFRFPLPYIFARRTENPLAQVAKGDLLTDDFAPAYVFEVTEERKRTKN